MKEIKAFIRPIRLSHVYEALRKEGHCCLTVFEGEGTGKYTEKDKDWPSLKFPYLHSKILKIEMVCKKENLARIIQIIHENASSGRSGDGLIYISDVEEVIRVRDGNVGKDVLH